MESCEDCQYGQVPLYKPEAIPVFQKTASKD